MSLSFAVFPPSVRYRRRPPRKQWLENALTESGCRHVGEDMNASKISVVPDKGLALSIDSMCLRLERREHSLKDKGAGVVPCVT